jgi:1,4-dihydroxy-2-naphthoate octaprenyltransferase
MATTAINNYQDFKSANRKHGFGYESHNAIVKYNLSKSSVLATIIILLSSATIFGFLLFLNTNFVVLILGAISFIIGVLYSFGPIPISRTPFGEVFSGGFMGFMIPFIAIYIHVFDSNLLNISLKGGLLDININILEVLYIILISMPAIVGIANIMLANNICDIEDDIENKRYTLPIYIGKDNALTVFKVLYYTGYLSLIILFILKVAPLVTVLTFGTFGIVNKNIKIFYEKQTKKDTFVVGVKNFVLMTLTLVLTLAVAVILKRM